MHNKAKDKTNQLRLLSQSVMLEEARAPYLIRTTMLLVCFCFIAFVTWAALAQITERATAVGEIVPSEYVQLIQHLEGGIIKEILVRDDTPVKKGQVLIRLRGESVKSDLKRIQKKLRHLNLQIARHHSFLTGDQADFDKLSKEYSDITVSQRQILEGMIETSHREQEVIQQQIIQKKEQVKLLTRELTTARKGLNIAQTAFATQDKLYNERLVSETTYLAVVKEMNEQQGKVDILAIKILQAKDLISEYELRLQASISDARDTVLQQLGTAEAEQLETQEMYEKLSYQVERLDILSPTTGVVKGLEVHTIGGVVSPGSKLMEIVPSKGELFAEVKISPNDIGHIRIGHPVIIKVTSYDFSRYGSIDGEVDGLSATTFVTEQGQSFYKGIITLKKNYVGNNKDQNIIRPGMIVNVDIITGTKSLLAYFLKPIHKAFNSAFTER